MTPELIIDSFAGGGGASVGIEMALGRSPDHALNHDPVALAIHAANHKGTVHHCQDIWQLQPNHVTMGRPVGLLWASPDCTHFSKAKGGAPTRNAKIRDLAWSIVKWAREARPRVIIMENVEEFVTWGPLGARGEIIKERSGETFRQWKRQLQRLGYKVEHRELRACDFGAPTIRKRFFLIARRDGLPIVWPEPTHGPGRAQPYRTAAECIDWSIPCPSIFERKRPLAENTLRRIAAGIRKFVIEAAEPFIVTYYGPKRAGDFRGCGMADMLGTQTTENRHALVVPSLVVNTSGHGPGDVREPLHTVATGNHHALVTPFVVPVEHYNGHGDRAQPGNEPMRTITAGNKGSQYALAVPTLIQTGYGERPGQAPRVPGLDKPLGTAVAGGQKHALVTAFLAKHYGGVVRSDLDQAMGTVTTVDHHSLVAAHIVSPSHSKTTGRGSYVWGPEEPLRTVTGSLEHGVVTAHLQRDFGQSVGHGAGEPCGTITPGGGGKEALVTSHLVKFKGTCRHGQPTDAPLATVCAKSNHIGEVRALLVKYFGTATGQDLRESAHTVTAKHRLGLVTVAGEDYAIADIGMRMLEPRELFRAQGFPDSYVIAPVFNDKPLPKYAQVKACGNSVCPPVAAALVSANCADMAAEAGRASA